jgi:hypothetical protein
MAVRPSDRPRVQFEEFTASPLEGVAEAVERLSRALAVASEQG